MEAIFSLAPNLGNTEDWLVFLFKVTLKGSLVLFVAFMTTRLFRRASAAVRHLIWTVAITSTLVLPVLSLILPAWEMSIPQINLLSRAPVENDLPWVFSVYEDEPKTERDFRGDKTATTLTSNSNEEIVTPVKGGADNFVRPIQEGPPAAESVFSGMNWSSLALTLWLLGAVVVFLRQLFGKLLVVTVAKNAQKVTEKTIVKIADDLQSRMTIRRPVKLLISNAAAMPMTWGVFRPKILLPSEATKWPDRRKHFVLLHEMAHVKRSDCLTQSLAQLAAAIYWFNPLLWIANRNLLKEREHACDDYVLSKGSRASEYADLLLEIARSMRHARFTSFATVAMARPSQLEGRMIAILDPRLRRSVLSRFAISFSAVVVLLIVVPLAAMKVSVAAEATPEETLPLITEEEPETKAALDSPPAESEEFTKKPLRTKKHSNQNTNTNRNFNSNYNINTNTNSNSNSNANFNSNFNTNINREMRSSRQTSVGEAMSPQARSQGGNEFVVKALTEALRDSSLAVRLEAVKALGDMKSRTAVPALMDAIKDPSWEMRLRVVEALGDIRDPAAIEALSKTVKDENWQVREQSIESLADLDDKRSIPALTEALQDQEWQVRVQAAHALGDLEAVSAVSALEHALKDENREVRKMVIEALGEMESKSSVKALTTALKDDDWEIRQHAAYALGEIGDISSIKALASVTTDPNREVRKTAVWTLGEIDDPQAVAPLSNILKDEDWEVRQQAAWALGEIDDPSAVTALSGILKDPHPEVRKMAAWALGEIDDDRAIPGLIPLLHDSDWEIRKQVAWALGEIDDPAAVTALGNALQDTNHEVRKMVIWALGEIDDTAAVPALITALKDTDWEIRSKAACSLGEIGDPRAIEALTTALKDEHQEVRRSAARALGELKWRD